MATLGSRTINRAIRHEAARDSQPGRFPRRACPPQPAVDDGAGSARHSLEARHELDGTGAVPLSARERSRFLGAARGLEQVTRAGLRTASICCRMSCQVMDQRDTQGRGNGERPMSSRGPCADHRRVRVPAVAQTSAEEAATDR
jgi:hypothetical protein